MSCSNAEYSIIWFAPPSADSGWNTRPVPPLELFYYFGRMSLSMPSTITRNILSFGLRAPRLIPAGIHIQCHHSNYSIILVACLSACPAPSHEIFCYLVCAPLDWFWLEYMASATTRIVLSFWSHVWCHAQNEADFVTMTSSYPTTNQWDTQNKWTLFELQPIGTGHTNSVQKIRNENLTNWGRQNKWTKYNVSL